MKNILFKLFFTIFLAAMLNISVSAGNIYNTSDIRLTANGTPVVMSVKPVNRNGNILIPAKELFETIGGKADFKKDIEQLYVHFKNKTLVFTADSDIAYINGARIIMPAEAIIINGSMLIPLKFLHNSLGFNIRRDKETVYINLYGSLNDESYNGYFNTDGYIITDDKGNIAAEYPYIYDAGCNVYVFRDKDNKMGVLNSEGKIIIEAKYTDDMDIAPRTYAVNNTITLKDSDRFDIYDTSGKLKKSVSKPVGFKKTNTLLIITVSMRDTAERLSKSIILQAQM